ncbi:MAG TPA: ABC transporter substrate-binding protein, partial [Thermomicrobiales bacterium]|nr:ABC transporter substrate-binding protein [Thermomicrobiales bacterium]
MPDPRRGGRRATTLDRRAMIRAGFTLAGATVGGAFRPPSRTFAAQPATPVRGGRPSVALARLPVGTGIPGAPRPEAGWIGSLCHDPLFLPAAIAKDDKAGESALGNGIAIAPAWNADRTELTFSVRSGVVFPDGRLLTAADVVASIEHARSLAAQDGSGWRFEHLDRIEATGDGVRIGLTQPDAAFTACIADPTIPILPATVLAGLGAWTIADIPAGSGPFVPGTVANGERFGFDANPLFWQVGRPRLGGLTVIEIEEDTQRTVSLVTGAVDMIVDAPLLDIPSLREDTNVTLVGGPSNRACVLLTNYQSGATSDRRLRQLIAGAIERSALVRVAAAKEAREEQTLFPKASWPGLDQPPDPTDWTASREHLAALGYPVGLPLRLVADERDGSAANAAVLIQEQLSYIGIAITLDLLDEQALRRALANRDYDLFITYTPAWLDPHELVRPLLHTDGPDNLMGYSNSLVDRLIDRAIATPDRATR